MVLQPKMIQKEKEYDFEYSFCTLMTNSIEYNEMLESTVKIGFNDSNTEFLCMDNSAGNQFDGYSGINRAIVEAKGRYLIFCHQDIVFCFDEKNKLDNCLEELNAIDPKWAVAGNAGRNSYGRTRIRISDPSSSDAKYGDFPAKVRSLDENFLVINRSESIFCSSNMSGFHLYATDFCVNARANSRFCYVIDFHLFHKSSGKIDSSYIKTMNELVAVHIERKRTQVVFTMCLNFVLSGSKIMAAVFKNQLAFKKFQSILKRMFNRENGVV